MGGITDLGSASYLGLDTSTADAGYVTGAMPFPDQSSGSGTASNIGSLFSGLGNLASGVGNAYSNILLAQKGITPQSAAIGAQTIPVSSSISSLLPIFLIIGAGGVILYLAMRSHTG